MIEFALELTKRVVEQLDSYLKKKSRKFFIQITERRFESRVCVLKVE